MKCNKCGIKLSLNDNFKKYRLAQKVYVCNQCWNEYQKEYKRTHKDKISKYKSNFIKKYGLEAWKERNKNYSKQYRRNHPEKVSGQKNCRENLRLEILIHYGGDPPKCACCSENIIDFLTIDHINGGGNQQRKSGIYGYGFYYWLRNNNYPKDYQVLCYNCNCGKGRNFRKFGLNICPHKGVLRW